MDTSSLSRKKRCVTLPAGPTATMSAGGVVGSADALPLAAALADAGSATSPEALVVAACPGRGFPRVGVALPPKLGLKPRPALLVSSSPARIVK